MIYKTYIDKFNTIVSDSTINTGINPISVLRYGKGKTVSRALLHFDHTKVNCLIDDGIMVDMTKMKHTLKITNGGSLDFTKLHKCLKSDIVPNSKSIRAVSFDLIFFLIPKPWDRGKGFDYSKNFVNRDFYSMVDVDPKRLISHDGSNWYQRMNGLPWEEEGIYSSDRLALEYDKWSSGEDSIVIGRQHFDIGNESIELDITDTFNKFLTGELENNGIGIAFSPLLEDSETEYENYMTLLTDKTSTFFEPFVETRYEDVVNDDRSNFVFDKNNKLYLYCTIGDRLEDLDKNPTVTVKDGDDNVVLDTVESKKFSRGIYYIDLKVSRSDYEAETMLYDTWGDIYYQGSRLDDVELDFVLKPTTNYFNLGNSMDVSNITFSPSIQGIGEKEQIKRGDIRKLVISAKPSYTYNTIQLVDSMQIRLYVKDGLSEIDVFPWDSINKAFKENFYVIDTNILLPQRYYVDIRIRYGMNSIIHHDVLSFDIVNDLDNRYA